MQWRRNWQPTPVFLPGESQGWGSLVGCRLWGRTESDTTEVTEQQQQQHRFPGLGCGYSILGSTVEEPTTLRTWGGDDGDGDSDKTEQ